MARIGLLDAMRMLAATAAALLLSASVLIGGAARADGTEAPQPDSPASTADPVCVEARAFLDDGKPGDAADLLAAVGISDASGAASCALEAALAQLALGEIGQDAVARCLLAMELVRVEEYEAALEVIDTARESALADASAAAIDAPESRRHTAMCGPARKLAEQGFAATDPIGSFAVGFAATTERASEDLLPLVLGVLAAALVILLLGRLLALTPLLRDPVTGRLHRLLKWPAWILPFAVPGAAIWLADADVVEPNRSWIAIGVLLLGGAVAVYCFGRWLATQVRIVFEFGPPVATAPPDGPPDPDPVAGPAGALVAAPSSGSGEASDSIRTLYLARLAVIGGEPATGIEIPVGTDVTDLADVLEHLADAPKSPGAIWKRMLDAVRLIFLTSPWRIRVVLRAGDEIHLDFERNGHRVAFESVGFADLDAAGAVFDDAGRRRALATLAAGVTVGVLGRRYRHFESGLFGATDPRSIGLHSVATIDLGYERKEAAIRVLEAAIGHDGGNRLATTALWNYRHRDATDEAEIRDYARWLYGELAIGWRRPGGSSLEQRLTASYLSIARNGISRLGNDREAVRAATAAAVAGLAGSYRRRGRRPDRARIAVQRQRFGAGAFALGALDGAEATPGFEFRVSSSASAEWRKRRNRHVREWARDASRSRNPGVRYSLCCARVARGEFDSERGLDLIRDDFAIGTSRTALREWAARDPELTTLRAHAEAESWFTAPVGPLA
ncbi:hypothetical protein [Agromyces seonyuensis]|uniref:Sel1 repeat family protein n=1 Tax=Agromyces seonyuensis TaxID=2662446 RepID=A0A6I4NUQ8_9MICO|nr:hypothetical protein [Agromyces seonyuensis]MWB98118.1 hypothetical protein [Agromyces seonyuensis]